MRQCCWCGNAHGMQGHSFCILLGSFVSEKALTDTSKFVSKTNLVVLVSAYTEVFSRALSRCLSKIFVMMIQLHIWGGVGISSAMLL